MYRIRMFLVAFAVIAALLSTSVLATGAHAATRSSNSVTSHTVHPLVNAVPCYYFHAVEIHNSGGTLCFEGSGHLSVSIFGVTSIVDTGNDNHAEVFYCNHQYLVTLANPGDAWYGYCRDLTDIYL